MSTLFQLTQIFREVFDDPGLTLTEQVSPSEIPDWDSVAQVKLVLAIEDAFGARLSTEEVANLHSVGDFLKALNKHQGTLL